MKNIIRIFVLITGLISVLMLISCASTTPVPQSAVVNSPAAGGGKAPEDVQAFFGQFKKDILTYNMKKIGLHYATNFKQDGTDREAFLAILSTTVNLVTDYVVQLTKYEVDKNNPDIARIDGTVDLGSMTLPFAPGSMIIKENGAWKWYGNQK